jgi:SNF2 family DNA or RNA helicase
MATFIQERRNHYAANMHEYETLYFDCLRQHYERTIRNDTERLDYERYKACVHRFRTKGVPYDGWALDATFCNQFEKNKILPNIPQTLRKPFMESKTVVKYVALKIRGECLGNVLSKERERCNVDMLQAVGFGEIIDGGTKKTVIFTSYVNVVDECFTRLTKDGYSPLRVYGDTNSDLVNIIDTFRKQPDANPLVATYQSLSTAVPLIMANTMIMLNSPFRFHEQEQAIARCWRIGQDSPVYVYRFFLDTQGMPNISTRSEDIFEWSRQQVNQLLGVDINDNTAAAVESLTQESHAELLETDTPLDWFSRKKYPLNPSLGW